MNAKELKTDSALGGHINDGSIKYAQSGSSHQNNSNKSYQDIGANAMGKVDVQTSRPCAIIGPDRVLPSQNCNDGYMKKTPAEPWHYVDNVYRQNSDYTHKISEYQPTRNISPRQTFQENMQRIMVSPYSSVKKSDDPNLPVDRNVAILKDVKLNMPIEAKYCEVPYTVNPACNEQKNVRVADMRVPNVNPGATRSTPHAWPHNNINVRPLRPYGVPELYQYSEYPSCTGPRPVPMVRPQRIVQDEPGRMYPEPYYQDTNIRFRPYPPTKGRYPQGRYEYVNNYSNTFHPSPPFPPQAYDSQKSMPSHSYPLYPQAPLKYIDRRTGEPIIDGYQRANPPQGNINVNYHNPIIHPPYGPLQSNCIQNNIFSYQSENSPKSVTLNKLPYMNNNKIYADYEILQNKKIPIAETVYANDMNRIHSMKGEVAYANYAPVNVHGIPQHTIYRRENISLKNFEYMPHLKNLDHPVNFRNQFLRHPVHFSPNSIAISPSDSNTSNDASQTHSSSQEDCGYVSQSSTTSGRSIDLHINGIPNEHHLYRSPDRYGFLPRNILTQNPNNNKNSKVKKDINVRQFLQMWNEGDDELGEQSKEENIAKDSNNLNILPSQYKSANKQEQLYVLGLVNVPSEELDKYDHIQKISKLPENIKGYNNIELLNQFEEVIESSNMKNLSKTQRVPVPKPSVKTIPRPVSPLDVEAKISQSVIHKEVGCNFEIKPCSPKMLNVEIATPVENILKERTIEKVSNPINAQAFTVPKADKLNVESSNFSSSGSVVINNNCGKTLNEVSMAPSCNMDSLKYTNDNSLDLEYNSSVCLASLPRLDNEIELNFPEINQQFINANKIESLTPIAFKESSNLDSGQLDRNIQHEKAGQITELAKCSPTRESDKEFTKLSKYRKLKKTDLDQKEIQNKSVVQDPIPKTQFRTDSVIIKNPDNVRLPEVNLSPSIVPITNNNTIVNNASTELSQSDKLISNVIKDNVSVNARSPCINNTKENTPDTENAIDFSLNKSDDGIQNICPKESIANESFLNFIEENLNLSESYENTKSPTDTSNHEFSVDNIKKVEVTVDATENNDIVLSSNDEREHEKNKNDDLNLKSDLAEENNEINKPIQLELNYATNSELQYRVAPTDIKMTGQNSIPTIIHNLNESSFNRSENEIPEIRLQVEDNSKTLPELENSDHENKIHKDDYSVHGNDFESDKINHRTTENYLDKVANETCQILHEKSHLNSLNIEATNALNFDCKNFERSLESIIDNNVQTFDKEVKIDCEYKIYTEKNIVPELKIDRCQNVTGKKFYKRLYSPVILNLINYNGKKPKENNASPEITSVLTLNVDTKRNNCDDQSIYLEENHAKLECKTLSTEILSRYGESLEVDVGSTEKSFDTKQFSIENSQRLSPNNHTEPINEESSPNTNNICTINDTRKSYGDSKDETANIEKTNNNQDCPEKLDTSNGECRHSTIEDNEMLLSNQIECSEKDEKQQDNFSFKEVTNTNEHSKRSVRLKRSLSDSVLNIYANEEHNNVSAHYNIPKKRKKMNSCEMMEPNVIAQNLCNIIQTNRRNSISTLYNEESVSFCILIDNSCDLIDENACVQKISLAEITEDEFEDEFKEKCIMSTDNIVFTDDSPNKITCSLIEDFDMNSKNEVEVTQSSPENDFTSEYAISERNEDKSYNETWIEDVACIETVFSDDITEDIVLDSPSIPKDNHELERESESKVHNESLIYNDVDHINKIKYIYGNEMCNDDVDLVETLYRTPQMDLGKSLIRRESQYSDDSTRYYDNDSLEKILSESNYKEEVPSDSETGKLKTNIPCSDTIQSKNEQDDKENFKYELPLQNSFNFKPGYPDSDCYDKQLKSQDNTMRELTQYDVVHSCESTCDYMSPYKNACESPTYSNSSSPEVSSTTSEEKSCGILLKITNCNGSISSQLNDFNTKNTNKSFSESTEKKELINYNCNLTRSRPLLTKAAQKYIPPLKETIPDLKIKLPLPKHSLNKLKILKISKDKPKLDKPVSKTYNSHQPHYPKKNKPKFEDVLKSIDEVHIKMHKEKNKKPKHSIPKVVIKKNENGAHYTSTSNDIETYNPDLTGRKWQPWVFIEKNYFIDKMALNNKAKAVFNYRKNTYVLAEKFRKYKSVNNAKFVISKPKIEDISSGKLKYTIRLKHNY